MRICPACQRENADDVDFCECGEYLRWDPTVAVPRVPLPPPIGSQGGDAPAAPGGPPAPPGSRPLGPSGRSPADAVSITLRTLAEGGDPREGVRVAAAPGQTATLVASVRNQSGIVDNYDLRVDGVPEDWWTITPATAYLVPYGAPSGRYEQDVQVHLHPPRAAQAEARDWTIRVVAGSRASGKDAGSASARVTVMPYQEVETEMRPERVSGRRRGKFAFAVRNLANAPIQLEFSATDAEAKLKFSFKHPKGTASPGKRTGSQVLVRPKKAIWIGRPTDHAFEIAARMPGSDDVVITRRGVYRQRPWFAWWVPLALAMAIALGLAAVKLLQHPKMVAVPKLEQLSTSQAQPALEKVGLLLASTPAQTRVVAAKQVGKVVGQNPSAGVKLKPGSTVSLIVGVAAKPVIVPSVCNLSYTAAVKKLTGVKLTAGPVQPSTRDPNAKTLATGCQAPAANQSVPAGSPVSLFLLSPGAGGLPAVGGKPVAAARSALQAAGFKTISIPVLATGATLGTVVAQQPGKGAAMSKGSTVYLYTATLPRVAYDTGGSIYLSSFGASGQVGQPLKLAPGTADEEPSWNADHTLVAFVDRSTGSGTIDVAPADGSAPPQPVATGADYHRPVFAPLAGSGLLVFARWTGATSSLCFLDINQTGAQPSCTADDSHLLDRPTWSADGMSIAVVAQNAGVIVFQSQTTSFSGAGGDWAPGPAQLAASDPTADPSFLAYSPVVNGSSQLAYATGNSIFVTPDPASAGTNAFDYSAPPAFAWRTDGVLYVGGQDCLAAAPPAMVEVTQAGQSTPLTVSGCNPSVEPLGPPPPG